MKEEYIQNELKPRKIYYYQVTEHDLQNLIEDSKKNKRLQNFTSFVLALFTISASILPAVISWGLCIITIISTCATYYFMLRTNKQITSNIRENPENYVGDTNVCFNIKVNQKDKFLTLFNKEEKFCLLETNHHDNGDKKDYFTFIIKKMNEDRIEEIKTFLNKHKIRYTDYNKLN